jgi:F-type H+-transporting ATPase subunit delta
MKITARQYALAIKQALEEGAQVEVVAKNFAKLLAGRKQLALWPQVIDQLEKIYDQESGAIQAQIVSVRPLSKKTVGLISGYLQKIAQAKKVEIKPIVDKNILGGVIIKYDDKVLDGSLKGQVRLLKQKLVSG